MASEVPANLIDLDSYVRTAVCEPGRRCGMIASKIFWFQLEGARKKWCPELSISEAFNRVLEICGGIRIIRLIRRDKIRQAISYICAYKTGLWRVSQEDEIRGGLPACYDFAEIDVWSRKFLEWERCWDEMFAGHRSEIVTIFYEDIMNCIEDGAHNIAGHMGIDLSVTGPSTIKSAYVRQSDEEAVDRAVDAFNRWQATYR